MVILPRRCAALPGIPKPPDHRPLTPCFHVHFRRLIPCRTLYTGTYERSTMVGFLGSIRGSL